jgi:hypothetical protein
MCCCSLKVEDLLWIMYWLTLEINGIRPPFKNNGVFSYMGMMSFTMFFVDDYDLLDMFFFFFLFKF